MCASSCPSPIWNSCRRPSTRSSRRDAEKKLADIAATVNLPPERVSAVVRFGSIYTEVLDEADKTGTDLVVIGSHRPTMATFLLGSNASTIVRHAKCSVLVVRA